MIWNIKEVHKEFHDTLMRRKRVDELWDSLLDNALIGLVLHQQRDRSTIILRRIGEQLAQALDEISVENHRSRALLGLCVAFFHQMSINQYYKQAVSNLNQALEALLQKELDPKFWLSVKHCETW